MRFDDLASDFHTEMLELVKKYQFRDRNRICCCGVSVSQCYTLEALRRHGPMTMKQLAGRMYLSVSTMTRIVDQLEKKRFVTREESSGDRRIRLVRITRAGEASYRRSWKMVFDSEKEILRRFPAAHREKLVALLRELNRAVLEWRDCSCGK